MDALGLVLAIALPLGIALFSQEQFQIHTVAFWKSLGGGAVAALVSILPEYGAELLGLGLGTDLGSLVVKSFVITALSEEGCKWFALSLGTRQTALFTPLRGIGYGITMGMGFAAMENVLFSLHSGAATNAIRLFTAVPGHGIYGVFLGYGLALGHQPRFLWGGLGAAIFFHGMYDFTVFAPFLPAWGTLLWVALGLILSALLIFKANRA